ncbi:MAG: TonB-dependent receptor [Betaproteobacteria bacterium]|nr:TonB-dependent receptor [Betaproteobacteria bacterium]
MQPTKQKAAALLFAALPAFAAELPLHRTEPVIVTATRFEQRREDFPIGVTAIEREAIERSTATTVVDLLSQQAGVQVRDSTGGPDLQIDLRGFGQTGDLNTVVLIDGQRFNDIDTSPVKWSSIPLGAVERIEILRGSGAVVYGSGATGGVINIITRRARAGERTVEAQGTIASYGAINAQGALTAASESVGLRATVSDLRSDNYRDNNRLAQRNLLADVRTLGRTRHVYAKLGIDQQDLRNPGQRTLTELALNRRGTATPLDFSSREGARIDVGGAVTAGNTELAANVAYRKQDTRAFFSTFSSLVDNDTESFSFSPRFKLPHRLSGIMHTLVGGVDIDHGRLDRNVSGSFFAGRTQAESRTHGIYLQNNAAVTERLLLTLGMRVQRAETALNDPATSPAPLAKTHRVEASEAALRYQATGTFSVYGKVGRSFRLPSVEEVNFTGPAILEPQTSRDLELGGEHGTGRTKLRVSLYRYNLENEIAFNPILFDNINLAPTRRAGIEIESSMRFSGSLELIANFSHVDARFRSGAYGGVDLTGNRVPLVPRNSLTLGASWLAAPNTRVTATLQAVGEQRMLNDETNTLAQQIPAYAVLDVKLAHVVGDWRLEAGIKNLLDEKYYTQGGVNAAGVVRVFPAPERNAYVTARYTFR